MNLSNWGRWGEDDELGALNFISPEKIIEAAKIITKGKVYSLSMPIHMHQTPYDHSLRMPPFHVLTRDGGDYAAGVKRPGGLQFSDGYVFLNTHGSTHMDALSHVWYDDQLYNGFSGDSVKSKGAKFCGIEKVKGIVTRAILLDLPTFKQVEHLEAGEVITPSMLDECAFFQGVSIKSGDMLFIRTGWLKMLEKDPELFESSEPGIGEDCIKWIAEKEIIGIAADNLAVEVKPEERSDAVIPVHMKALRDLGVYFMELFNFEELAKERVYECMFVAAPLSITGAVGSPLNPLAIT
ncbi:cyclase family protein [Halalkalibacter nanhaiisediminis]|uniref:Kynurenine formamidase n=1 Tax=Halalkalibacter nanhaiisediminis TaxID=688079 RepID=A0A562QD85_9BACI|nr:cyclase family protein [Halalkalibacter nanhaiisediminis]TWI54722.1 kynurenine formamidase [Halalkalibacter nanhaiisediminis]